MKKRKLQEVGSRQKFDVDRTCKWTDLKVNLSVREAPFYQNAENHVVDTTITRSWNDKFTCTAGKGGYRHSIHKMEYFNLIISDQHMVAKVPALDLVGIATCRFENPTLAQLIDHTFLQDCRLSSEGQETKES